MFVMNATASADAIRYPNLHTPNPLIYSFTAAATGEVVAYFAGSTASFDNQLGMLDDGILTSAGFGLDNHTSSIGQVFDLGFVTAGDTLVLVLKNNTLGKDAYSDPSLNASYDSNSADGHNHVYYTPSATSPVLAGVPKGAFVSFEDLPFPGADFNYNDEDIVLTNVAVATVPEPTAILLLSAVVLLLSRRRFGSKLLPRQHRA